MKRYTTRFFKSVAMFYMSFPVAYILIAAVVFDIPAASCLRVLLSPFYYVVAALAVAAGYGLFEMRRWAWYVFLLSNILVLYESALLASEHGVSHHKTLAFGAVAIGIVFLIFRVAREVRVPYFFPRIPWWESDPRYRLSVNANVTPNAGSLLLGEILDLSLGGCFLKIREELPEDALIALSFSVFGQPIECRGVIVWRTQSTVTHPKGVGIKFQTLSKPQRKALRQVLRKLKRATTMSRRTRFGSTGSGDGQTRSDKQAG